MLPFGGQGEVDDRLEVMKSHKRVQALVTGSVPSALEHAICRNLDVGGNTDAEVEAGEKPHVS
jgi:hypothetical protein